MADNAKWYVIHTYSGYENAVKAAIEKAVENRNMRDMILKVEHPHGDRHRDHRVGVSQGQWSARCSPVTCSLRWS